MASSGAATNPYINARNLLVTTFYPTPTLGFNRRLLTLLGVTSYLFVITSIFLVLYWLALRRQGKKVWAWRKIQKPEGKYIMANIYVASIVPNLLTAILLGALIIDTRNIYIKGESQYQSFLWRNITGLVIWIQGWISTFSNVQAVLIISTKASRSSNLPKYINLVYLVVPTIIGGALLTFGLLASFSWNYIFTQYESLLSLLLQAATLSESFDSESVSQLAAVNQTMKAVEGALQSRFDTFYQQYLILLSIWSVASIILVAVNCAGILLIFQLHKQMKFQAPASICNSMQEVPTRPKMGIRSWSFADSFKGSEKGDTLPRKHSTTLSVATSNSGEIPSALADNPSLRPFWTNVKRDSLPGTKPNNTRAMRKLERDLIITISGVTFLSVLFSADTIFFAFKQRAVVFDWQLAEIGLTLIIWAYVTVLSVVVTLLTLNQIVFLFRSIRSSSTSTVLPSSLVRSADSQEQKLQTQDRKLLTRGIQIQINSCRQVSFDRTPLNFDSVPPQGFVMALNGYNTQGTLRSEWDKEISPIMKGRKASWASSLESEASWTR